MLVDVLPMNFAVCELDSSKIQRFVSKVFVTFSSIFNFKTDKRLLLPENSNIDVVHVHNFFPLFSPSVFYFFKKRSIATVLTLHNYRTICPTALLMFDGKPCEKSIEGNTWWALKHKVYRGSFLVTLALILQIELHKKLGTWQKKVDRFVCLSEFSRQKFISAGFPANKIVVKPNFTADPGFNSQIEKSGNPIFVGRLSVEKGICVLSAAASIVNCTIDVVGEGSIPVQSGLNLIGKLEKEQVTELLKISPFLVMPSICYETFGMVLIEAFACGTPVICSRLGSMAEIVEDGVTGLHFNPGDPEDLAVKINYLLANPAVSKQMGENARQEYLKKYTPEKNLEMLLDIYQQAIIESRSGT